MSQYYLVNGYNETGKSITLEVGWEHKKSELRCLCVVDDKEYQEYRTINAVGIAGGSGVYTIAYPFSVPGLPWRAYLWRDTTRDRTITFDGGAIPVTAILTKITELSDKADEAKVLLERVLMAPEDADGKLFIPPVNVRKGEILGFDDEGRPTVGEDCEQVKKLIDAQGECKKYVSQAKGYADQANVSMLAAGTLSADAYESAKDAAEEADEAKKYALEAQGWTQKVADTATKGIEDVEQAAKDVNTQIDGKLKDAVSLVDEDAQSAEEDANRAEQAYEELSALKTKYEKLECFIACAAKKTEANKNKIVELLAENADGLNKLDNAAMRDGDTLTNAVLVNGSAAVAATLANTHDNNANFYGWRGTFAALGAAGEKVLPQTISMFRRKSDSAVDSSVGRYLRVLRLNADTGTWYVAYQSTNALAPNSFASIGDEMKWTLAHVAGTEWIPAGEEIAVVQTDDANSEALDFVYFGARTTPAYGGGLQENDLAGTQTTAFAPAISMEYQKPVALATAETVAAKTVTLQEAFNAQTAGTIDVGAARTFVTAEADGGYRSGIQLSDFAGRIFAVSPGGAMNGFMAMAADGVVTNRVFGGALQLAVPAENDDEAVTLAQVNAATASLLSKTATASQAVAGEVSFTGGVRISSLKSTAGSAIYDTTDSKGFNFRGIYRLFGYDINNAQVGTQFFEQVDGSTNWIDVTTLKLSGTDITTIFARKTDLVLGASAQAQGNNAIAIGNTSPNATGDDAIAVGTGARATAMQAVAYGLLAQAMGTGSVALGPWSQANGDASISIGNGAYCENASSVAIGLNATVSGTNALLIRVGSGSDEQSMLSNSVTISVGNGFASGLRIVSVAAASVSDSYFIFQHNASGTRTGVKISAENFFAMLKTAGGEDYTATPNDEATA